MDRIYIGIGWNLLGGEPKKAVHLLKSIKLNLQPPVVNSLSNKNIHSI